MKIRSVSYNYNFISNHLGSATLINDINGNPYQFFLNLPFGETFVDRHSQTGEYENVYKFNGKELDTETGYYYYGARYYNARISQFYATDPLAEKYYFQSPYTYATDNPVGLVDVDGMGVSENEDWVLGEDGKYTWDKEVTSADDPDLNGRKYIGKSIKDVLRHYKENNPISSFFGGNPEFGDISDWTGEIITDSKTWLDNWAESDNLLAKISYETINSFYIVGQSLNPFDNQIDSLTGENLNDVDRSEYVLMLLLC